MAKSKSNPALRRLHARGKHVLKVMAERKRRGLGLHGIYQELGAHTSAKKSRWREARCFAMLYPAAQELNWICSLGQKVGRPLTPIQVAFLCRVANRNRRNALAKKCAEEGWTVRKLEREIEWIAPRHDYGGARPKAPPSVEDALIKTERMAGSWIRWVEVLEPATNRTSNVGVPLTKLPKPIRTKLLAIKETAEKLCRDIADSLDE